MFHRIFVLNDFVCAKLFENNDFYIIVELENDKGRKEALTRRVG